MTGVTPALGDHHTGKQGRLLSSCELGIVPDPHWAALYTTVISDPVSVVTVWIRGRHTGPAGAPCPPTRLLVSTGLNVRAGRGVLPPSSPVRVIESRNMTLALASARNSWPSA